MKISKQASFWKGQTGLERKTHHVYNIYKLRNIENFPGANDENYVASKKVEEKDQQ